MALLLVLIFLETSYVSLNRNETNSLKERKISPAKKLKSLDRPLSLKQKLNPKSSIENISESGQKNFSLLTYNWQNQTLGDGQTIFLYSAYMDGRGFHSIVRILGIARHKIRTKLNCVCVDRKGYRTEVGVDVRQNKEHWNLPYSSYYFNCILRGNFQPVKVSVASNGIPNTESSWLPVQFSPEERTESANTAFGLCVKPLYGGYNRALWMVEFINFYQLLGITHITFYNHSIGPEVDQVLRHLMKEDVRERKGLTVRVLPWALPVESQMKIRTEAQFSALNDCNLQFINRVKYAAMVDLDEFLIPNTHDNLTSLLDGLNKANIASFSFQNVFFYLYWANDTSARKDPALAGAPDTYLLTLYKTRRLAKTHRHGSRSKYVVKPENVVECGNHAVWLYRFGKRQFRVNETLGTSHHYRICEFGGFSCTKKESSVDTRAHHWAARLVPRVAQDCVEMFGDQGCPPAPPLGSPY